MDNSAIVSGNKPRTLRASITTAWRPTCDHDREPVPCLVLDPFNGSGTTGVVALGLGRSYIGCELNEDYAAMARERLDRAGKGLDKREASNQGALFGAEELDLFGQQEEDCHGH